MHTRSQRAGSANTTTVLAVAVLALVGVVVYLVWRQGQPTPTPANPTPGTNQSSAPAKIELPKTFATAVPKADKDHAERLDKELEKLNDLLKDRAE